MAELDLEEEQEKVTYGFTYKAQSPVDYENITVFLSRGRTVRRNETVDEAVDDLTEYVEAKVFDRIDAITKVVKDK